MLYEYLMNNGSQELPAQAEKHQCHLIGAIQYHPQSSCHHIIACIQAHEDIHLKEVMDTLVFHRNVNITWDHLRRWSHTVTPMQVMRQWACQSPLATVDHHIECLLGRVCRIACIVHRTAIAFRQQDGPLQNQRRIIIKVLPEVQRLLAYVSHLILQLAAKNGTKLMGYRNHLSLILAKKENNLRLQRWRSSHSSRMMISTMLL